MDWQHPDYDAIFAERMANLKRIRENPDCIPRLKLFYRDNPAIFISDWGVTFDPRNAERGLPTLIPFILFPKQIEWVNWTVEKWRRQTGGMTEKSRDMGISWLATGTSCTLCLFYDGVAIGFGSRKEEYVDKIGAPKALLPKARMFMEHLPEEFRGGWVSWRDAPHMRINFPETGSIIMGEAGDQIGRGDRASIYFTDEDAYLERPDLVENSLSQTTNCRISMSSVNGMNNTFAKKRHSGKVDVFIFDWRDDPRKDQIWYDALSLPTDQFLMRKDGTKVYGKGLDPVTIAQEVDRDYQASVTGIVIPAAWVRAAIDAREKLKIPKSGLRGMALDIADEGKDKNAAVRIHGIEIEDAEEWSGKGGDIFMTVERAFELCDEHGYKGFRYDADGLGAGARGDARVINERRKENRQRQIILVPFRGSQEVFDPEGIVEGTMPLDYEDKGRTNKDYFANRKAQAWWNLRRRFQRTYRWVVEGKVCNPDEIISISSKFRLYQKLVIELSQATYGQNGVGKMLINKAPKTAGQAAPSPNLADCVVMRYADIEPPQLNVTPQILAGVRKIARRRP